MSKDIFAGRANEVVEGINRIEITPNTVRFGTDVYQLKNVTGFGMVTSKRTIPVAIIILALFIVLLMLLIGTDLRNQEVASVGIFLLTVGLCFAVYNAISVPTYGLKLYLPSNENKIFWGLQDIRV